MRLSIQVRLAHLLQTLAEQKRIWTADWAVQTLGIIVTDFPATLGEDIAGIVICVGRDVTHLKEGDRVIVWAFHYVSYCC